jgi:hypothetical protein
MVAAIGVYIQLPDTYSPASTILLTTAGAVISAAARSHAMVDNLLGEQLRRC